MGFWKTRPVMTSATVTAVLSAVYGLCAAFDIWEFTDAQQAAVAGLIGAVALLFGKSAATNVFIPETVEKIVAEDKAVAEEAVRQRNEANDLVREAMAVAAQAHNRPVAVGPHAPQPPPGPPVGAPSFMGQPVGGRDPRSQGNF